MQGRKKKKRTNARKTKILLPRREIRNGVCELFLEKESTPGRGLFTASRDQSLYICLHVFCLEKIPFLDTFFLLRFPVIAPVSGLWRAGCILRTYVQTGRRTEEDKTTRCAIQIRQWLLPLCPLLGSCSVQSTGCTYCPSTGLFPCFYITSTRARSTPASVSLGDFAGHRCYMFHPPAM